jgi:hypothetical protein
LLWNGAKWPQNFLRAIEWEGGNCASCSWRATYEEFSHGTSSHFIVPSPLKSLQIVWPSDQNCIFVLTPIVFVFYPCCHSSKLRYNENHSICHGKSEKGTKPLVRKVTVGMPEMERSPKGVIEPGRDPSDGIAAHFKCQTGKNPFAEAFIEISYRSGNSYADKLFEMDWKCY